ncbi:MAG TPA: Stk1 family PASTA domain-containing Ser/Thr kinase [Gaiellaceae bacterium]|nr:Stk1 family PASTA domain-containing Ser/Thr kinase [Gaiellaceae bacterium]
MATQDTLSGTLFATRYRMIRKLGGGGMADVYLAEDQELGRRVAIKILHERYANDEQFVERFRREAKHAAGLSHPNIVSIFDRGETNGSYYIVMEYVEGRTLKELIRTRGPCPVPVAIAYTRQILGALRYAHRTGLIHRDIKPHNVIVDSEGVVKVADFGIARAGASQMTEEGSIIGTAQYLSPEQARGAPVDQTSDLYSTGIVLFELLTGDVPFTGDTPVEIAMKHLSEVPDAPSARRPDVPPDLDLVVLRALAKDPGDRYQSAATMDSDLDTVAHGGHVPGDTADAATVVLAGGRAVDASTAITQVTRRGQAVGPGHPDRYEPIGRRRTVWPWLVGLGALLALLVGAWVLYETVGDRLGGSGTVAVPYIVGLEEARAESLLEESGLVPNVRRVPSSDVEEGLVIDQDPEQGTRVDRESVVVIDVSSGKPEVTVPNVVGLSVESAVATLTQNGLTAQVVEVFSDRDAGTVTAQQPRSNTVVVEGTSVRVNVSKGARPITVPSVVGVPYEQAVAELNRAGLQAVRVDESSDLPEGSVTRQDPRGGSETSRGTTVTLYVSRGPDTTAVPDVTATDVAIAQATLESAGFRWRIRFEDTTDQTQDGIVLSQDPAGESQARPNAIVTLFVGRFVDEPSDEETTPSP